MDVGGVAGEFMTFVGARWQEGTAVNETFARGVLREIERDAPDLLARWLEYGALLEMVVTLQDLGDRERHERQQHGPRVARAKTLQEVVDREGLQPARPPAHRHRALPVGFREFVQERYGAAAKKPSASQVLDDMTRDAPQVLARWNQQRSMRAILEALREQKKAARNRAIEEYWAAIREHRPPGPSPFEGSYYTAPDGSRKPWTAITAEDLGYVLEQKQRWRSARTTRRSQT